MNDLKLRFPGTQAAELPLGIGVHGIGRAVDGSGVLGLVSAPQAALVCFCVDRRGVWLTLGEAMGGVHVNGRPVRRMAMLRVGDLVHVDGVEIALVTNRPVPAPAPAVMQAPTLDAGNDPRIVLRGVGGRYHGRSFTLERPRLVGRNGEADIRIDDPAFADRHARIDLHGDGVLLRDLGSAEGTVVNGEPVRDALLRPGDQIVFDAHHRFVVEAPGRAVTDRGAPTLADDEPPQRSAASHALGQSARRLPWLLLAALLIAGALSALLLFGSST